MMRCADHILIFLLIAGASALAIAGTDLILPAIPLLPRLLNGTPATAQFILASFTAGVAAGLMIYGELGARFDERRLLAASLLLYSLLSAACSFSVSMDMLIALRFLQGASGSAAAVFAPAMLRAMFDDAGAIRAIGLLGTMEAMAPALAPIIGLWLLHIFGWRAAFDAIAILAALLLALVLILYRRLPVASAKSADGSYRQLLRRPAYLYQALSHAFTVGALLVIVFGAPTVFVAQLGGTTGHFIAMQICGITLFALAANIVGRLVPRFGAQRLIVAGTAITTLGCILMLLYALAGGREIAVVIGCFLLVNGGLGLRGPPGFHQAIVAAQDDARGAALLIVAILLITAAGTAIIAPFITSGLSAIAGGGTLLSVLALALLVMQPRDQFRTSVT